MTLTVQQATHRDRECQQELQSRREAVSSCQGYHRKYADKPGADPIQDEISMYLSQHAVALEADPLAWWRQHQSLFPVLARLARKFLAIPATSAPVERVWSTAGNAVTKRRARLADDMIDAVVFCHENIDECLLAAVELEVQARKKGKKKS
jgi:hypothetical protein